MARKAREISSTGVYAVILKGVEEIFKTKTMKNEFMSAADKYIGDGLMGIRFYKNRVEMLVNESEKGISMDMKPLTTSFARTYNRICEKTGKVYADRFKSVPVETDELKEQCIEYLNGGKTAAPYETGAVRVPRTAKKQAVNKPKPEIEVKKPDTKQLSEIKPEPPKPKKKKDLPSWLL